MVNSEKNFLKAGTETKKILKQIYTRKYITDEALKNCLKSKCSYTYKSYFK